MQWSLLENGGFTTSSQPLRPVITGGDWGYEKVNVTIQRQDPGSLLSWFERMIRTLREAPEVGAGSCTHIDISSPAGVLAHRADDDTGTMVFVHNLGTEDTVVDLSVLAAEGQSANDVLADQKYPALGKFDAVDVAGYGYRWIRLRRSV